MKSPKSSKPARPPVPVPARFFRSAPAWRSWLERHHDRARELWMGFHRKGTATVGVDYDLAVEIALCFGWIDGIRKKRDETTYVNRFTPRKPGSNWSRVNIARVERLTAGGLMHPAGLAAYARRQEAKSGVYSFEQRPQHFPPEIEKRFRNRVVAWKFFSAQPPGYRRLAIWWIVSAKRDETRLRRLQQLIDVSGRGLRLGVLFGQTGERAAKGRAKR